MKMPWQFEGASCSGVETDYYFPEQNKISQENVLAKKICSVCVWQSDCLTYALHYKVLGIWGGTTLKQRDALRKKLNIIGKPMTNERHKK
jgi:hypothetical protein